MQEESNNDDDTSTEAANFASRSGAHQSEDAEATSKRDTETTSIVRGEKIQNESSPAMGTLVQTRGIGEGGGGGRGGYEGLDARGVEEARRRAQRPAVYVGLHSVNLEELYSRPIKKKP